MIEQNDLLFFFFFWANQMSELPCMGSWVGVTLSNNAYLWVLETLEEICSALLHVGTCHPGHVLWISTHLCTPPHPCVYTDRFLFLCPSPPHRCPQAGRKGRKRRGAWCGKWKNADRSPHNKAFPGVWRRFPAAALRWLPGKADEAAAARPHARTDHWAPYAQAANHHRPSRIANWELRGENVKFRFIAPLER